MDKMTDARALDIIAAYGAEPEAWPEQERAACEAAIARAPDVFAKALEEARLFDGIVAAETLAPPAPSDALIASIIASAPEQRANKASGGFLSKLRDAVLPQGQRWPAMAAAASLAIGLGFGLSLSPADTSGAVQDDQIIYAALGLSDYDAGYEELN